MVVQNLVVWGYELHGPEGCDHIPLKPEDGLGWAVVDSLKQPALAFCPTMPVTGAPTSLPRKIDIPILSLSQSYHTSDTKRPLIRWNLIHGRLRRGRVR